jgi:hypothetical protein
VHCQRCKDKNFLIACADGCGQVCRLRDKNGEIRSYVYGHNSNVKGWFKRGDGHIAIIMPEHPQADKKGYVIRSRAVYEESRDCCLLPYPLVVVHHRDRNPLNDVWYNLKAMWNKQHSAMHNKRRDRSYSTVATRDPNRSCMECGSKTTSSHWYRVQGQKGRWRCRKCASKIYDRKRWKKWRSLGYH